MLIRKVESVTMHYAGENANLNPEDFRKLSKPYLGNTDEEFTDYIESLLWNFESIIEEIEDENIVEELYKLTDTGLDDDRVIWDSRTKGATEWIQSGTPNDDKHCGMDVEYSTNWD